MSAIVVSKKAHNAFRYFTLLFALIAVISIGANIKMLFDVKSHQHALSTTSELLDKATDRLTHLDSKVQTLLTEKQKLQQKLHQQKLEQQRLERLRKVSYSAASATNVGTSHAQTDVECLARAIYYEAGSEPAAGKRAVAHVVLNRMGDKRFPSTACGVVYQGANDNRPGCQFSWACDGINKAIATASAAWQESKQIAAVILSGNRDNNPVGGALFFHNNSVRPKWATSERFIARIGGHNFYR